MKGVVIDVTGQIRVFENTGLDSLQAQVDGMIEGVDLGYDGFAFVNEEGKLVQLPLNIVATALLWARNEAFRDQDVVVGPMVIVGAKRDPGDGFGLTDGEDYDAPDWALALADAWAAACNPLLVRP